MTNEDYKITRGRVEVEVPHQNGRITFVSPAKGPETYADVQEQIMSEGLIAPTMAQTASLIYTANQNKKEPEFNEVISRLNNNWLWGFTGILYVPNKGAYIQDNPKVADGRVAMNKSELVKKLEAGDKSVRFVPFGYKLESQKASDIAKNPFVIALAGEEGTEKLAKISESYGNSPYLWSFKNVDNEIARVSGLRGYCYGGYRLLVYGNDYVDGDNGYALGVCETSTSQGAKSAQKK